MRSVSVVKTSCGLWVIMQSRERVHRQSMFMEFTATVFAITAVSTGGTARLDRGDSIPAPSLARNDLIQEDYAGTLCSCAVAFENVVCSRSANLKKPDSRPERCGNEKEVIC